MAAVISRFRIDDNDYERFIPLGQTGAGITPINLRVDDGDISAKIMALQVAAGITPLNLKLDRKDWNVKLLEIHVKLNSRTATITIASPAVVSLATHGFVAGTPIKFATTGALPTGITVGPTYYVSATGLAAGTFQVALTAGGASINTTGTQSGVHTVYPAQ